MTKVKIQDKTFIIEEMVKTMETKDIINMIALEIEKEANKYHVGRKERDLRIKNLRDAILAIQDVDEVEEAVTPILNQTKTIKKNFHPKKGECHCQVEKTPLKDLGNSKNVFKKSLSNLSPNRDAEESFIDTLIGELAL